MIKKTLLTTLLILGCLFGAGELMGQKSLPYSYGFENNDLAAEGWTSESLHASSVITKKASGNPANSGDYYFKFFASGNSLQTLISPQIEETSSIKVNINYRRNGTGTLQEFRVGYSTSGYSISDFDNNWSDYITVTNDSYDNSDFNFSIVGKSGIKYIAIQFNRNTSYTPISIDDIVISSASCPIPTGLSAEDNTSTTANVSWTAGGDEEEWTLQYSTDADFSALGNITTIGDITTTTKELTGLNANTTYYVRVKANCSESEESNWTDAVRTKTSSIQNEPIIYGFEDEGSALDNWTMRGQQNNTGVYNSEAHNGSYCFRFSSQTVGSTQYLITPELTYLSKGAYVTLYRKQPYAGAWIQVGYSTTTNATEAFTWSEATPNAAATSYVLFEYNCPVNTKFVAIKYTTTTTTDIYIDDISIIATPETSSDGDWNIAATWGDEIPSTKANVIISSNVTIPADYTAQANNITIDGGSITIEDGGQLVCNNNPTVTFKKSIDGWGTTPWYFIASPVDGNINPVDVTNLINEITSEYDLYRYNQSASKEWQNYKVHGFNLANGQGYLYANADGANLSFTGAINPGDPEESYTHSVRLDYSSGTESTIGWNLVGNPFTCNATLDKACYTIKGNQANASSSGTTIAPGTGVMVKATGTGQSVTFTKAPNTTPDESSNNNIQLVLSQTVNHRGTSSTETLDNAIVSFNEGSELSKFYFGTQNANIYIPQNGKEFAIVSAGNQNMVPVNFKAHVDGQYTLTFSSPQTSALTSLHLIDNLTGANVDLLQTPSYTFQGRTTDIAARFRLLFTTTGVDENDDNSVSQKDFAFVSDGQLIVNGNGTLYVYDALGRQISVEQLSTVNCLSTANYPTGLYLLQLVDGNSVRTQKIIVK